MWLGANFPCRLWLSGRLDTRTVSPDNSKRRASEKHVKGEKMEKPDDKPPIETDIRFWAVVLVIWACLLLGFMNISTKIDLLLGIFSKE